MNLNELIFMNDWKNDFKKHQKVWQQIAISRLSDGDNIWWCMPLSHMDLYMKELNLIQKGKEKSKKPLVLFEKMRLVDDEKWLNRLIFPTKINGGKSNDWIINTLSEFTESSEESEESD